MKRFLSILIQFLKQKIVEIGDMLLCLLVLSLFCGIMFGIGYGIMMLVEYITSNQYGINFMVGLCSILFIIIVLFIPIISLIEIYKWLKDNWIKATRIIDNRSKYQ